jgi:hypothetical protein
MEVKLIKVEGCVVGWSMEGENLEEMKKLLSETSNSLVLKIQK